MSTQTPAEQAGINIDITVGALLIGTYISTALFGFTTLQGYNYYINYPDDRWKMKSLVSYHCSLFTSAADLFPRTGGIGVVSLI